MANIQLAYEIRDTYNRFDADGNGRIDLAEFRALLTELGAELDAAGIEVAFDTIDVDENGFIDYGEFSQWWDTSCL
jgi:calmodulin